MKVQPVRAQCTNTGDLRIEVCWTNSISSNIKNDFITIQSKVFGFNFAARYSNQFEANIYGPSIIVVSYCRNRPAGAWALWRNDLEIHKAFQAGSTAVLEEHRGQGLFRKMVNAGLRELGDAAMIYNFPNDQSLPGYLKMGWTLRDHRRYRIVSQFLEHRIDVDLMGDNYLSWILKNERQATLKSKIVGFKGSPYLLRKRFKGLYIAIASLNYSSVKSQNKVMAPFILEYSRKGYLGRGLVTVVRNVPESVRIPIYKVDTMF